MYTKGKKKDILRPDILTQHVYWVVFIWFCKKVIFANNQLIHVKNLTHPFVLLVLVNWIDMEWHICIFSPSKLIYWPILHHELILPQSKNGLSRCSTEQKCLSMTKYFNCMFVLNENQAYKTHYVGERLLQHMSIINQCKIEKIH